MPDTPSLTSQTPLAELKNLWVQHLRVALSSMLGEPVEIASPADALPPAFDFWFRQPFSPLSGALWFGFARGDLTELGKRLLAAAGLEEESEETAIETFGEIVGQAAGALATEYSNRLHKDVRTARLESNAARPADFPSEFPLLISCGGAQYGLLAGIEGTELLSAFGPQSLNSSEDTRALAASASAAPSVPLATSGSPDGPAPLSPVNARNLDLLLDVELPVSVSFGRAQLLLKDVIKLTTGSIVELNRSLAEPVDIIVNNCVIAKGEVVVVEGNFGVRIKQIISKQDRLRSVT